MNNNYNNSILILNKKINNLQDKINNSSNVLNNVNDINNVNNQNNQLNQNNQSNKQNNKNNVVIVEKRINYFDILKKKWIDITIIIYLLALLLYFTFKFLTSVTVSYNDSF